MAGKSKRKPSFFKVLVGNFVDKLRIPPSFVKNFKGNVPTNITVKSGSGSSWRVKIQDEGGGYFFCGGWSTFVKDHSLETGDFLLFFLLGRSKFDVIVYNRTACEKNITLTAKRPRGRPVVNRRNEETPSKNNASCSNRARTPPPGRTTVKNARNDSEKIEFVSEVTPEHPTFVMVVKEYHKYSAAVPIWFSKETGMAEKESTLIKDSKGGMWMLHNVVDPKSRVSLGAGWSEFRQDNAIAVGDTLLFEHIPNTDNSIHVRIISKARRRRRWRVRQANEM
ncbi:hypothetical protein DITRI_Ditri16bG0028600 [Diplodiscus trichospermus]